MQLEWTLVDKRLKETADDMLEAMGERQDISLRRLADRRSQQVRYTRFLANPRVEVDQLVESVCAPVAERVAGRHVLLVEDTSELNYQAHAGRVRGMGTVGNGVDPGLFLHPVLTVDAEDGCCLGLGHLHLWRRHKEKAPDYQRLPIEEKESYRWLEAAQQALPRVENAACATVVADREADIYEMFERLPPRAPTYSFACAVTVRW